MNENRIGIWRALFGWIDQPKKTLRYVIKEPRWPLWLAPVLIILVTLIIVTVVSAPFLSEMSRQQAEEQIRGQIAGVSGEQEEQVRGTLDTFTSPLFVALMGIAFATLGLILTWLFRGALLFSSATFWEPTIGIYRWSLWSFGPGCLSPCETWCRPSMSSSMDNLC